MRKWLCLYFLCSCIEFVLTLTLEIRFTPEMIALGVFLMIAPYAIIGICLYSMANLLSRIDSQKMNIPIKLTSNVVGWVLMLYFFPIMKFVLSIIYYPVLAAFYVTAMLLATYPATIYLILPMTYIKRVFFLMEEYGYDSYQVQLSRAFCMNRLKEIYGKDFDLIMNLWKWMQKKTGKNELKKTL